MCAQAQIHIAQPPATAPLQLCRWYMVADGNQHRPDLCPRQPGFQQAFMLSEALLPQIRTVACLLASERQAFAPGQHTPDILTEEADWFAARILVLGVRVFHLDITLIPMLKLANRRAQAFARRHNLPFTPAQMRMSLHAGRPQPMLIAETADPGLEDAGMVANSLALRRLISQRGHPLLQA